jgi:very-short-patch-repair endonuclease
VQYSNWMTIARRQSGVLSRAQCERAGLSAAEINGLIARDALVKLSRGVFRLRGAPAREDSALWHAAIATGGSIMGPAAAWVWQIERDFPAVIEVLLPPKRRVAIPEGVRVRRLAHSKSELTRRFRLPVTDRARTVLDCVALQSVDRPVALFDRALSQGWLTLSDVERRLSQPVQGNGYLRTLLRTHLVGAEAESERRLHRLLRQAGIAGWVPNLPVPFGGGKVVRVDVAFEGPRLAIEVDGFEYHSGSDRFQRDRTKQNSLVALGWTVLRFTWWDLAERPDYVLATIRRQLAILERLSS